jgi:hypothetical protein
MQSAIFFRIRNFSSVSMLSIALSGVFPSGALAVPPNILFVVDTNTSEWTELRSLRWVPGATRMNDSGQVAGLLRSGTHWALTGPDGGSLLNSNVGVIRITGINASGQVSGTVFNKNTNAITGPNGIGFTPVDGRVTAINDSGQAVGLDSVGAFITGPNGHNMTYLYTLGVDASPAAINASGQVAGTYGFNRTFITGPNGTNMRELESVTRSTPEVAGINAAGRVVVNYLLNGNSHAFITGPNGVGLTDIGSLNGADTHATGINDIGQVVGVSGNHGFITGPNGSGMTDLTALVDLPYGNRISQVLAINNNGQILVVAAVPEPETYALLLMGLGVVAFMSRRKLRENFSCC